MQASFRSAAMGRAFQPAVPLSRRVSVQVRAASAVSSVALPLKAVDGSDKGTQELAIKVASAASAKGLVHRYLVMVQQNARRGTASTKTRMEVRGGGRKPYAQKGTGNARRGSTRSPLFPGGGVTFGPKPKDWSIKMNKKERRLALATALNSAHSDIVVIEDLDGQVADKKTKSLVSLLNKVGAAPTGRKTLLILKAGNADVQLAGRNVEKLFINTADAIKVFDVLASDKILIEEGALAHINSFYGAAAAAAETETATA